MQVSAGFSVQVAHRIGGEQEEGARNVVRHGLVLALLVSGFLCLLGAAISGKLPVWLGGDAAICEDASKYFLVYALMIPFSQFNSALLLISAVLRGYDDTERIKCGHVWSRCGV